MPPSTKTQKSAEQPNRIYLAVPFREKNEAKALGAKWDRHSRSWYVAAQTPLAPFQRWRERAKKRQSAADPRAAFGAALRAAGLIIGDLPLMDGKLHRVPVEGDRRGKRSGAYVGYLDGHPAGFIQNFPAGVKTNWRSEMPREALSAAERARLLADAADKKREREAKRAELAAQTARIVEGFIRQLPFLSGRSGEAAHPYLKRKNVAPYGVRLNTSGPLTLFGGEPKQLWSAKGHLIVPLRDIDGTLLGAQSIAENGRKVFPRGAALRGGHHLIGQADTTRPLLIAEGYATAATLHEATRLPVAAAFSAGNLEPVARAYRERYPDLRLIIAGDNDSRREGAIGADGRAKRNVGRVKAEAVAQAVGGAALLPRFGPGQEGSDWNDFAQLCGRRFPSVFNRILRAAEHA